MKIYNKHLNYIFKDLKPIILALKNSDEEFIFSPFHS